MLTSDIRPKRTLGLIAKASELLAKADFENLAVVEDETESRIEFLAHHLVANNQGLFFIPFMQCLLII